MNKSRFKAWLIFTITLPITAIIIRLVWHYVVMSTTNLAMLILLTMALLGVYALFVYLTLKPELKILKTLPVGILITVLATAGLISAIIHMIRFISPPESVPPLSIIIAGLHLVAGVSGYFLLLWFIWLRGKSGEG